MLINHLAIIGVGLIGGSLARALRTKKLVGKITGCNRCEETLRHALELNVIDDYSLQIEEATAGADVIVIGTPLSTTAHLLPELADVMSDTAVLTDVGSAKGNVVDVARHVLGSHLPRFVPGHPIAGTEQSGVAASFAELFVDHRVILTPLEETDNAAHALIAEMWRAVGATVVNLNVTHHDRILAATSHLPHMLAYALVDCLAGMEEHEEIFKYAAGGFADFSRIASSSPEMWHDICISNRRALLNAITIFSEHIERIRLSIKSGDGDALLRIFQNAKAARDTFARQRLS